MKKFLALLVSVLVFSIAATNAFAISLPEGYGGIKLGMSVDEVKSQLKKNPQFGYRGDRDVSMLPGQNEILIETDTSRTNAYSFLTQCYFQFYEEKLYIITININPKKMDYYSIFTTLCDKYENPPSMNPQKAEWDDDSVIMTLERPLCLKYTDKSTYEDIQNKSMVRESAEEMSREEFLKGL